MILGVDVGSYSVKSSKGVTFLSKLTKHGGFEENSDYIIIDSDKWYLGEGDFDTEYRKAYRKSYINLMYAAIALSTDEAYNNVVVGLPLSQYKEDRDYLRNIILQNSNKNLVINDVSKQIVIKDLEVVPEGIAAVNDNFEGIVIDIGGRTTDICLITNEFNKRKINKPYSLPLGVLNLENDFISIINNTYALDLFPEDTQRILNKGLKIYGEEKEIDFAMEVYKKFVNKVISILQVDYPIRTHNIALIGGGAEILQKPFIKRLPNAELMRDGYFSNAIGYEFIGKEIWG